MSDRDPEQSEPSVTGAPDLTPDRTTPAPSVAAQSVAAQSVAAQSVAAPSLPVDRAPDGSAPASGPRRLLVAVYAIFALAATARAVVQLATQFDQAPLAYLLSLFSGLVYIAATVGLVSHRSWSRPLALAACSVELVGVVIVGTLSIVDAEAFPKDTVWSRFGSGYGYIPLILPIIGIVYLLRHRGRPA